MIVAAIATLTSWNPDEQEMAAAVVLVGLVPSVITYLHDAAWFPLGKTE